MWWWCSPPLKAASKIFHSKSVWQQCMTRYKMNWLPKEPLFSTLISYGMMILLAPKKLIWKLSPPFNFKCKPWPAGGGKGYEGFPFQNLSSYPSCVIKIDTWGLWVATFLVQANRLCESAKHLFPFFSKIFGVWVSLWGHEFCLTRKTVQ